MVTLTHAILPLRDPGCSRGSESRFIKSCFVFLNAASFRSLKLLLANTKLFQVIQKRGYPKQWRISKGFSFSVSKMKSLMLDWMSGSRWSFAILNLSEADNCVPQFYNWQIQETLCVLPQLWLKIKSLCHHWSKHQCHFQWQKLLLISKSHTVTWEDFISFISIKSTQKWICVFPNSFNCVLSRAKSISSFTNPFGCGLVLEYLAFIKFISSEYSSTWQYCLAGTLD